MFVFHQHKNPIQSIPNQSDTHYFHHFQQMNLNASSLRRNGEFDVIFLRNVLIYFDVETKRRVIANLLPSLKRDGYFIVGHSESLNGINDTLLQVRPTVYQRP